MRSILRVVVCAFMLAAVLYGQQLTSVSGVVADPTGAMVPAATITIESLTRGTTRQVTSDRLGRYVIAQIQPDRYKILAKAPGFADVVVNDLVLQVNTPATVNITFEKVGTVAETISVSAEAAIVSTNDASIGNTIGSTPILQLPAFARNVVRLLALQPGVTQFGNVNGGKSDQGNVTLDGIDVNDQQERTAFTSVLPVTLDSVQEFRTTTSNATADQGRSSGAQVALVTKSGTNDFHGSLYHYHRNTVHAANSFFLNRSGVKRPALLINIPGGSVGGPIMRNKLFFFLNYEERRDASAQNVSRIVPSNEFRNGIILYRRSAAAGGGVAQLGPDDIRRLDPGGIGVNSAAQQVFRSFPAPNAPELGDGLNRLGFRFTAPIGLTRRDYTARFDYNFGSRQTLFWRGSLRNDRSNDAPQFPGEPPRQVFLTNAKGFALGHNFVITPAFVSTFRYGLTRIGRENTGLQTASAVSFRGIDDRVALTRGLSRIMPTHHITEDFAWTRGSHDVRFGGVLRWITNRSNNLGNSFHSASTNVSWLRGTGSDFQVTDLNPVDRTSYGDAMAAMLGIVTQVNARWNYGIDGSVLPVGTALVRNFKNEEYEMYGQDTWKLRRNLTITYGLRYSLMPPPFEANGVQISADQPLGAWFDRRGALADAGRPQSEAGLITFVRADSAQGRPLYPFHKKNFAPRFGIAYSPEASGGFSRFLFGGPGRTWIRAGWGMYYDLIGQPLARTYDLNAFGFSQGLTNASGQITTANAPRFTGIFNVPTNARDGAVLLRPAPPGGFPVRYPNIFAITASIDDQLENPYTMNMNFSIGREISNGWFVQGSYVARQSRKSLINRDLAQPTNFRDPASGTSYNEAATQLERLRIARTPIGAVPRIPFWENLYGNLATSNRSATQVLYEILQFYPNDFTSLLADIDMFSDPGCSRLGCNIMFSRQFSALSAWSSIAGGNYHSMQWTLRKRFGRGLTMDFNYTYAKSTDLASVAENGGSFAGFIQNSFEPQQMRAVSSYDQRHIYNALWVWELPFGKGKRLGGGANRALDYAIGGWQLSGVYTEGYELPVSVNNGRNWPTNWNVTPNATPVGTPPVSTRTKSVAFVNGRNSGPNIYGNPQAALDAWTFTLPGQSGSRNTTRIDGTFNLDLALAKRFIMPYHEGHSLQFRWETFNVGNTNRFSDTNLSLGDAGNFGNYTDTRVLPGSTTSARQMQFALRYEF